MRPRTIDFVARELHPTRLSGDRGRPRPRRGPVAAGFGRRHADLLGRPDLLRRRQQAPDRHHHRLGRGERRRRRSRDDQPERDRAEGLGGGRVEHHAGRARPGPRPAAAALARRTSSAARRSLRHRSARRRAAGSRPSTPPPTRRRSPAGAPASRSASAATCSCAAPTCSSRPASPRRPRPGRTSSSRPRRSTSRRSSGLGLALSNVGDGNVQVARPAVLRRTHRRRCRQDRRDQVRRHARLSRAGSRTRGTSGVFPPGTTTWDGAGDNQAYLSGQAAFIANTGSVGIAAQGPRIRSSSRRPPTRRCRRARRA